MQDIGCKLSRLAAIVIFVFGMMSGSHAQGFASGQPWEVGDVAVCFNPGTCNMLRINGSTVTLLDQFSDLGNSGVTSPNNVFATGLNNNLHLFTTDDGGNGSNIVEYTIASVNPFADFAIPHTVLHTFDGTVANGSTGIKGLALDVNGNMFIGNANPSTIVELNQGGGSAGVFLVPSVTAPAWLASNSFNTSTTILDPDGHVQKVKTPGTSGAAQPSWSDTALGGGITRDNAVVWTDLGAKIWAAKTSYALNALIIDPASHLQKVITAGTSGNKPPTWNDAGGTTKDASVTWTDLGSIAWIPSHSYAVGQYAAGTSSHLEQVTISGVSGPAVTWTSPTTTDGLTWADQGWPVNGPCIDNALNSLDLDSAASAVYFTSGPGGIIQKVTATPLSSGSSCTVFADFGPNVALSGLRLLPAGSVAALNGGAGVLVVATGTVDSDLGPTDSDSNETTKDVCTGASPAGITSCALLLDSTGTVKASYVVAGTNTLQALALGALVTNCIGGSCAPNASVNNFLLGDSASDTFYNFSFTAGLLATLHANVNCNGCVSISPGIQGMGVYGAEGANQPHLAQLFQGNLDPINNTAKVQFPLPINANNTNTLTVTGYNLPSTPPTPLNLYASLIPLSTGANDFNLPCRATTSDSTKCILWKVDAGLPPLFPATLAEKFAAPATLTAPSGIDISTDVFVDESFDTTTSVGNFDPTGLKSSVHSLHEITGPNNGEANAGCSYGGNLSNRCFQNPNNITFKFTCTSFPGSQLQNYAGGQPNLVIVQDPFPLPSPAPAPIPLCNNTGQNFAPENNCILSGTGGTTNWRFDPTANQFVFNWNVAGQGTYRACTFDPTHVDQPFCVNFSVAANASCP